MSKIHTHYDNLKVSRMAPQEVIRAAYKALSQKYHPDKNPGDEKAARIMAILNSAYGTLSDVQRRREHDEWIAAEEWEIEWLESTKADEEANYAPQWVAEPSSASKFKRGVRMSLIVALCMSLGWGAAVLMQWHFQIVPNKSQQNLLSLKTPPALPAELVKPVEAKPLENKVSLSTQVVLLGAENNCSAPSRPDFAPNGDTWPAKSGYLDGYKIANGGGEVRILLDNSNNQSDSMVTLLDREKHQAVRHVLVRAHEKFTVENLQASNYEVQQHILGPTVSAKEVCDAEAAKQNVDKPIARPPADTVSPSTRPVGM